MARFDVADWCDLVRGVADPHAEWEMRESLASDDDARRTVDALSRVAAVARADEEASPPEYAVRMAKAIASVRKPTEEGVSRSSILKFLPFEVTFDSLREPALAGTRDMQVPFRQFTFESQDYTVDVRWDQDADPRTTVAVGQVLRRPEEGAPRPVARIPVLVTAEGEIVGHSVTSEFGEFQAAGLPEDGLELFVLVGGETCIRLPLGGDGAD